jgi:GNAT superfamily N-acetyltransferase
VHENSRNKKLGSVLLKAIEDDVREMGGKILWIETSGRPLYASTESFYHKNGYQIQASLRDFYGPGDPKQIYSKVL